MHEGNLTNHVVIIPEGYEVSGPMPSVVVGTRSRPRGGHTDYRPYLLVVCLVVYSYISVYASNLARMHVVQHRHPALTCRKHPWASIFGPLSSPWFLPPV